MVQPSTSTASPVDDQLREVLSQFPVVQLAILFGSLASGRARPDSDLDLGIVCARLISVDEKIAIIGSDEAFARLLYRRLIAQADFMPIKNRIMKERRMAWIGK